MSAPHCATEAGLAVLQAEGLQLLPVDIDQHGSVLEALQWHRADWPVDADLMVLLWVRYGDGTEDWTPGWMDTAGWRFADTAMYVHDHHLDDKPARVLYWAQPLGPRAFTAPQPAQAA